jgi:Zn-dependent peptidase ImmA (M78 family)
MRNLGSVNNTIIHECVHWDLHKKFFELEKLYNKEARSIRCQVQEGIRTESNLSPLDWMEWQANALAPRILMPVKQTRQKIEELIEKNKRVLQTDNMADIMGSVVFELSDFFEVSKQAAKIRMLDLGWSVPIKLDTNPICYPICWTHRKVAIIKM